MLMKITIDKKQARNQGGNRAIPSLRTQKISAGCGPGKEYSTITLVLLPNFFKFLILV